MAQFTIDLDGLLMKNYKTYGAGLATIISAALVGTGYIDVVTGIALANGFLGAGLFFLRLGVSKIQKPVNDILAQIPEIPVEK